MFRTAKKGLGVFTKSIHSSYSTKAPGLVLVNNMLVVKNYLILTIWILNDNNNYVNN